MAAASTCLVENCWPLVLSRRLRVKVPPPSATTLAVTESPAAIVTGTSTAGPGSISHQALVVRPADRHAAGRADLLQAVAGATVEADPEARRGSRVGGRAHGRDGPGGGHAREAGVRGHVAGPVERALGVAAAHAEDRDRAAAAEPQRQDRPRSPRSAAGPPAPPREVSGTGRGGAGPTQASAGAARSSDRRQQRTELPEPQPGLSRKSQRSSLAGLAVAGEPGVVAARLPCPPCRVERDGRSAPPRAGVFTGLSRATGKDTGGGAGATVGDGDWR